MQLNQTRSWNSLLVRTNLRLGPGIPGRGNSQDKGKEAGPSILCL